MKNVASIYSEYCCGCGLCKAVGLSEMEMSEEGFCIATGSGKKFDDFCKQVCPVSAVQMIDYDKKSVWGKQTVLVEIGSCKSSTVCIIPSTKRLSIKYKQRAVKTPPLEALYRTNLSVANPI